MSSHRNCCLGLAREPLEPLAPRDAHTRIHRATSGLLDARQSPARRVAADAEHAEEALGSVEKAMFGGPPGPGGAAAGGAMNNGDLSAMQAPSGGW